MELVLLVPAKDGGVLDADHPCPLRLLELAKDFVGSTFILVCLFCPHTPSAAVTSIPLVQGAQHYSSATSAAEL
jgi:hypothetical protein